VTTRALALRITCIVLALVACAWFGVCVRQARDTDRATALLTAAGPVDAVRVSSLLNAAAPLNPDRQVDLLRAQLALRRDDPGGARRIIQRVVSAEPMNLAAWLLLAKASRTEATTFFFALIHINQLAPAVHRRH
jgi:hypothetical protein